MKNIREEKNNIVKYKDFFFKKVFYNYFNKLRKKRNIGKEYVKFI